MFLSDNQIEMYKFYDFIVDNIAYKFTDSSNTSVETARKEYYYE